MSATLDAYLQSITGTTQTIFESTAAALDRIDEDARLQSDPFGKAALRRNYGFNTARSASLSELPARAVFAGTGNNSANIDITLTNTYTKRIVDPSSSDLSAYTAGTENRLKQVVAYTPETGKLSGYVDDVDDLVAAALKQLNTLPDALTNVFIENISTYHRALWQSGFLAAVQSISTDNIQNSIETAAIDRVQDATALVSGMILTGLNRRGFALPAQMTGTAITEANLLGSYMTTDIQRQINLAATKITQRLLDAGINVEQLQARFTSSANNMELELDKIRYAAAEAKVKGSIEILRGSVEGLSGFIQTYINAVELPTEWLNVEEKKLQATTQQARTWDQWTEAVTSAQKLTHATNEIHFSETDNNLQLAELTDNLDRKKAALTSEKVDAKIRKLVTKKDGELIRNAGQQELYAAKIQKASMLMRRADAELRAYIGDFTAQYTKAMSVVDGGKQLGELSKLSGLLLGQIVNESQINVTSNKVT